MSFKNWLWRSINNTNGQTRQVCCYAGIGRGRASAKWTKTRWVTRKKLHAYRIATKNMYSDMYVHNDMLKKNDDERALGRTNISLESENIVLYIIKIATKWFTLFLQYLFNSMEYVICTMFQTYWKLNRIMHELFVHI